MKRARHTPEQIIRKLREAERLLAAGKDVEEVCRTLEISVQTYHRWKAQYQAMRPEEVAPPEGPVEGEPPPEEDRGRPGPVTSTC